MEKVTKFTTAVKKICRNIKFIWQNYPLISSAIVLIFLFFLFAVTYLQAAGISALDDQFFHFRYAEILREKGWDAVQNFQWIYFTSLAQEKLRYPVSLFQIALIPFTFFQNKILGLKISDIFWASLSLSLFYFVLRKIKIRYAFLIVLVLLSIDFFSFRLLTGRAYILIVSLVFLETYWAVEKDYKKLFGAFIFHILWHSTTFFLPIVIIAIVETARYMRINKVNYRNIMTAFFAVLIGIAVNQQNFLMSFWLYMKDLFQIHESIFQSDRMKMVEGIEMIAKSPMYIIGSSQLTLLVIVLGFTFVFFFYLVFRQEKFRTAENGEREEMREEAINFDILMNSVFLFTLIMLGGSLLVSGRFYDFYFPSSFLLGALVVKKLQASNYYSIDKKVKNFLIAGLSIFLFITATNSLIGNMEDSSKNDYQPFAKASEWIQNKSEKGDLVFLLDWDNFPALFFFNSNNNYTMGMEPRTTYNYNAELFWKWYNIFLNNYYCDKQKDCLEEKNTILKSLKDKEDEKDAFLKQNSRKIIESIKNNFQSKIVVSNSYSLNEVLEKNKELIEDSFEAKSERTSFAIKVYKLK